MRTQEGYGRWLFLRTLQNELSPNQANASVKQLAIASRPGEVREVEYFMYSRTRAVPPKIAIVKNSVPVTSSQSWCAARVNERSVVFTPLITAFTVRLRPARSPATRATTPNFRKAETLLTILDFNSLRRYNDPTLASGEPFGESWHLRT